jgi:hypoxanthine phosphoribosyltransferase
MSDIKHYLSWDDVEHLTLRLARIIEEAKGDYDVLLGIARGGTIPATLLAQVLEHGMVLTAHLKRYAKGQTKSEVMPHIVAFPSVGQLRGKRVLIIDEVHDHGHSMDQTIREAVRSGASIIHTAVLHFKPSHNQFPNFRPTYFVEQTEDWIVYPWEVFADKFAAHKLQ